VIDTFSQKALVWDANPQVVALADRFAAELERIVPDPAGLAMLEFGCGTGLVGLRYAARAASLDLVDTSPAMLGVLRGKAGAGAPGVRVHEAGIADPTIGRASVDWLISNMALHHVADIPALLARWREIVKPGGRVTIGELEAESGTFHAPEVVPHNGFEPRELAKVFQDAGFTGVETHTFITVPREDNDGVVREYSGFILDALRPVASTSAK